MSLAWKDNNFYDLLEVSPGASAREIHEAFKRARATYSGENPALYSMFTKEEASELLKMIEEAYQILSNEQLRHYYDSQLSGGSAVSPATNNDRAPVKSVKPHSSSVTPAKAESSEIVEEKLVHFDDGTSSVVRTMSRPAAPHLLAGPDLKKLSADSEFESTLKTRTEFTGLVLRQIREKRGFSLDDLSTATKVSRTYLEAVERMDRSALPAAVFVRGFISHVARAYGLDEKKVVASYMELFKNSK